MNLPERVTAAVANARELGFEMSCDQGAGAVPPDGRILELGTGAGVGLSWIVDGLAGRDDVEVVSIEMDPVTGAAAAKIEWPGTVTLVIGDALDFIAAPAQWDLVFADAQGGKWEGLADTIQSLRQGGHAARRRHDSRRVREQRTPRQYGRGSVAPAL